MWSLWACETITASRSRGSNVNWRFGLSGSIRFGVEQPAIEQDPVRSDLQQVGAARDLPGRAVERDSQTTILPPRPPIADARPTAATSADRSGAGPSTAHVAAVDRLDRRPGSARSQRADLRSMP